MSSDAYLDQMHSLITKHGHVVQYVGADLDRGIPAFAYTVGLSARNDRPYELALSGLTNQTACSVLNSLASALVLDGLEPHDGLELDNILAGGWKIRLQQATDQSRFGVVRAIYHRDAPAVWQALWPDNAHRFPGDPGYKEPLGEHQQLMSSWPSGM